MDLIKKKVPLKHFGETIGTISCSHYYANENIVIDDIATELENNKEIFVFAVVNSNEECIGLIVRSALFDILGKLYGRDVYKNHPIKDLMKEVNIYHASKSIFEIANSVSDGLYSSAINYYLLNDSENKYYGIFSTKDLLFYLSEITRSDISLATKIQSNIVKNEHKMETKNFRIIGASKMARGVGGDFYSIKEYSPGKWLFAICDVSGKGISAALITTIIGAMLNTFDFKSDKMEKFLTKLNEYIFKTFNLEKFVTGMFFTFDSKTGKTKLYDMGHAMGKANLYLYRDKKFSSLVNKNYNLPIGVVNEITTTYDSFKLTKNDKLIMITDGVTDQRNEKNEEYGIKRIASIMKEKKDSNLNKIKKSIFKDIEKFQGKAHQYDDITIILLEILEISKKI